MKQFSVQSIVFNLAGVAIVLYVSGYIVTSLFKHEVTPVCSQRYTGGGEQFSLQTAQGVPLSPIELQARVPTREWGLLKNARVVQSTDKKSSYLQVSLGKSNGEHHEADASDESARDGVGFVWNPTNLEGARSACLSYRVFLPKNFPFDDSGTLPGLFGLNDLADLDVPQPNSGLVTRAGWQRGGTLGLALSTPVAAGQWLGGHSGQWPVDRWVSIEQEIVLNTPAKADGVVRLWVDGDLKVDNAAANLGAKAENTLSGVVADFGYNQEMAREARLTISPFIVQRQ